MWYIIKLKNAKYYIFEKKLWLYMQSEIHNEIKMFRLNINYINKVSSCQKYKVKRYVI